MRAAERRDDVQAMLTIANSAHPAHRGAGTGHGLIGMAERVEASGGTLTAELTTTERYVVRAVLPLRPPA